MIVEFLSLFIFAVAGECPGQHAVHVRIIFRLVVQTEEQALGLVVALEIGETDGLVEEIGFDLGGSGLNGRNWVGGEGEKTIVGVEGLLVVAFVEEGSRVAGKSALAIGLQVEGFGVVGFGVTTEIGGHHIVMEVTTVLAVIIEHSGSFGAPVLLQQESSHLIERSLDMRLAEGRLRQEEVVALLWVEDVAEGIAILRETEEAIQVLKAHTPDEGWRGLLFGGELIERGSTVLDELHIAGRYLADHLLKGEGE